MPKNNKEEGITADLLINILVDRSRLIRPRFPLLTQLATVETQANTKVRITKRDLRYYFHKLRNGTRWRPFLAYLCARNPRQVRKLFKPCSVPVARSWPMGL